MDAFLDKLSAGLGRLPVPDVSAGIAVAFSGGLDSSVLLTGLTRLAPAGGVRALHIDHALRPESAQWEQSCRTVAATLGVGFTSARVSVDPQPGQSLEAAARSARYRALAQMLQPRELLVTAHHGDDQLETVLLRLLRGSGVRGLRGIAEFAALGAGYLGRPLLRISRGEIRATAQAWGLSWLEDPSNRDLRFDRNFLRTEVLPRIRHRWPGAGATVGRAAQQMAEAQDLLHGIARRDACAIDDPARASQAALLALPPPRQRLLVRYLIEQLGLPTPSATQLESILAGIGIERADAQTQVQWPGGEARVYRGCVYLSGGRGDGSGPRYEGTVSADAPWSGPEGCLALAPAAPPGIPDAWAQAGLTLRFRAGGELFKPLNAPHARPLKKWLQEARIVPWMRGRIPLLYRAEALVAVGDIWVSDAVRGVEADQPAWTVRWSDHPPLT